MDKSSTIDSFADWVLKTKYLSRWVVLALDSVASAVCTLFIVWVIDFMSPSWTLLPEHYVMAGGASLLLSVLSFMLFGTYRGIMRHSSLQEMWRISASVFLKSAVMVALAVSYNMYMHASVRNMLIFLFADVVVTAFLLIMVRVVLIGLYQFTIKASKRDAKRIFVYGNSEKSIYLLERLIMDTSLNYKILGYVVRSDKYSKMQLRGYPVYSVSEEKDFGRLLAKTAATGVIFPDQDEAFAVKEDIIDYCTSHNYSVLIVPKMNEVKEGDSLTAHIREIKIEDLLGREVISINMNEISSSLKGKTVMVTGAAGSIGSELCRLVSGFGIKALVLVDAAETPLHNMQLELQDMKAQMLLKFVLGDVKDIYRMEAIFRKYRPDVVFHAAAYKHVPMVENNPCEGVNTNVFGTKVIADLSLKYDAERFVMVSTDKAVNPTNVMGATKRIAEIYVQSLGLAVESGKIQGKTKFITTRFGNVLGSNGSVIPRFREQIMKGGPLTVTDRNIIRYFMTIPEACRLVLEAAYLANGNKIYVFDMGKPVKIYDLARNMIELAGFRPDIDIKIEVTGLRPGEKLYEELLNNKENTVPTDNEKIFIAKVREYEYDDVVKALERLREWSLPMNKRRTVKTMKEIVPEFISNNSIYCELDEELVKEGKREPLEH